jgi:ribosome-binding protein aMBF1 (putative translation factor)
MDHQDWNPVVVHARPTTRGSARQIVERKSSEAQHLAKVEREEYSKPKMLAPESRKELVEKRLAEKMTQQQLDQRCSFPPHTIRDLEGNKRAPTPKELATLNRVLRCGLKLT